MAKFYLRILWTSITEFWGAADKTLAAVTVLLFFTGIGNQRLAESIVTTWNGISPWWSLLPVGLFACYRVLRANYEAFATLEMKVNAQVARETIHEWIGERLQDSKKLADTPTHTQEEIYAFQRELEYWVIHTQAGLEALGLTADKHLFATADAGCNAFHASDLRQSCLVRREKLDCTLREILKSHSRSS